MRARLALLLAALAVAAPTYTNPVIAGDHPDPTVVRAGGAYYASATTSAWAPIFPLWRSADLVGWTPIGAVLHAPPAWATGRFWAPELAHEPGRFLAYWGAARADGAPCIALSTTVRAAGPWRYRGRVTCPPRGAIDPQPFRDVDGSRWLLYKGAGGIRIVRLGRGGLRAVGPSHLLLAADAPWEDGVTEGPALRRVGSRYLLLYAGGRCCRVPCTYAEGAAASSSLLGPYVKDPQNPFLRGGGAWACPGHGTPVSAPGGGLWLVHHATAATDTYNIRRQVLLDPLTFGADGWPAVGTPVGTGPAPSGAAPQAPAPRRFSDGFSGAAPRPGWEWLFDAVPDVHVGGSALTLRCAGPLRFLARQVPEDGYVAVATVRRPRGDAAIGLAVDLGRGVRGIELRHGMARAFAASPAGTRTGPPIALPGSRTVTLSVALAAGGALTTFVNGTRVDAGPAATGAQPTRVALTCRGRGSGTFASVRWAATAAPAT